MILGTQILLGLFIGSLAGVCSGLFGIGGGVIIVPFLMYVLNYNQQTATATSLIALVLPVGAFAIYKYYQSGFIQSENIQLGLVIAFAMFAFSFLGAKLATQLPAQYITKSFAVFLFLLSIKLFFQNK